MRPRRRVVRGRAPGVRDRLRDAASGSGSTGWPRRVPAARALLDGERGDQPAGRPLRLRPPPDPAAPGPGAPADHDRRRRASRRRCGSSPEYADMWNVVRHARDARRTRTRSCARTARTSAATRPRSSARSAARSRSGRPRPRRERVVDAALEHNRTPRERRSTTTTRSGPARPSRSPRRCSPTGAIGFDTFIVELPAPYDAETMETPRSSVVKPMVDAA